MDICFKHRLVAQTLTDTRKNIKSNVAMSDVINPVCTVTVGVTRQI